jgi:hypothetical protein
MFVRLIITKKIITAFSSVRNLRFQINLIFYAKIATHFVMNAMNLFANNVNHHFINMMINTVYNIALGELMRINGIVINVNNHFVMNAIQILVFNVKNLMFCCLVNAFRIVRIISIIKQIAV